MAHTKTKTKKKKTFEQRVLLRSKYQVCEFCEWKSKRNKKERENYFYFRFTVALINQVTDIRTNNGNLPFRELLGRFIPYQRTNCWSIGKINYFYWFSPILNDYE